ncbi:unnamed protein product [Leptidea sinapis]|uniref:Proteasome alpha-type subunits domain-containing protein n=1 Tax=Leptidea sinapis TaxID=189913 RepID=A0A5E4QSW4_9NEOP|nr:unnamed protein product [Leptidea sinapis]
MSRYDRAITVFSPDGQLLQVHYAQEAVRRGSAVVGIRGSNAIVLAVEKRVVPELQSDRTEKKIVLLDDHIIECQSYRLSVEDPVTTEYVARYLAGIMQQYTQSNGRRPFGVSCLIGGFDADGPHLFQTEPSGTYYEWMACSTGRCEKTTRDYLEKNFKPQLVTSEHGAILLAVASLLEVQYGGRGLEVAILKRSSPITKLSPEAIQSYITEVQKEKEDREKKT